jgi:hypothetical protein
VLVTGTVTEFVALATSLQFSGDSVGVVCKVKPEKLPGQDKTTCRRFPLIVNSGSSAAASRGSP